MMRNEVMFLYEIGFKDLVLLKSTKGKESLLSLDEIVIQIGNHNYWLWIAIEPIHKSVLGIHISDRRNVFVAENFLDSSIDKYDILQFTLMGVHGILKSVFFLHLKHKLHSSLEKSLIERVMQYFKDRIECFDDYYPCITKEEE